MTLPWEFNSNTTPVIYHYTSAEAAQNIVKSRSIWLSEYTAMNDTSEFTHARDHLFALMRDRVVYVDTLVRFCLVLAVGGLNDSIGLTLASLTSRRDDLGQWRSYASNGQGCVLGLDASYLQHDGGVAVRSVVYNEAEVGRLLRTALSVVQQQYIDAPDDTETLAEFARSAAVDLFNIKHPAFADEREVRIARMLVRAKDGTLADAGGNRANGSAVPPIPVAERMGPFGKTKYVALPLIRPDGSSAIIDLGLGPTMSDADRILHRAFFEAEGLTVWQSTLPYRA